MKKELMIHEWKNSYLNLPLDDYVLSFDDGLSSQVDGILNIIKAFPDIKIFYYISTGILNISGKEPTWSTCREAHRRFFEDDISSDFITYDQLLILSKIDNVTIGIHGHKHLNLETLAKNKTLKDQLDIWEDDIRSMVFSTIRLIEQKIIDIRDLNLHYCTPYNSPNDLHTAIMRKQFKMYFPYVEFNITGPGRKDIEKLV